MNQQNRTQLTNVQKGKRNILTANTLQYAVKRPCFELQYMAFYAPKDALLKHKRPHIRNKETIFDRLGGIYFRNKGFLAIFALNMNFVMTDYDHTKQTYLK